MLPDAVRRLVNGWSIKPAERAVVLTVDDRGLRPRDDLEAAGVEIAEIVDFRERAAPRIEAQGKGGKVAQVSIDGTTSSADLARHVRQPAAELQAARAGGRAGRVRRERAASSSRPSFPTNVERGRRRHRRRR